jgi:hypothetical protein
MSLPYYVCKICKHEVPVREDKGYGFCRYCGNRLTVTEIMKKYHGMSDTQILAGINSLQELIDIFNEKCDDDFNTALEFLKKLTTAKDDPELMVAVYHLIRDKLKDVFPEEMKNELCIHFLDGAASSQDCFSEAYVEAAGILARAYNMGNNLGCKKDTQKAFHYYLALSKNPNERTDSFYMLYLLETDKEQKQTWLELAAAYGNPKAKEKMGIIPDIPCAYFNGGICNLHTGSTVTMHCTYFTSGRAMAACPDYRIAP